MQRARSPLSPRPAALARPRRAPESAARGEGGAARGGRARSGSAGTSPAGVSAMEQGERLRAGARRALRKRGAPDNCSTGAADPCTKVLIKMEPEEEPCSRAAPGQPEAGEPRAPGTGADWPHVKQEVVVKAEPEDVSYAGYPQGLGGQELPGFPSTGIKAEVVVKLEPEDESYSGCAQSYSEGDGPDDPFCDTNPELIVKVEPEEEVAGGRLLGQSKRGVTGYPSPDSRSPPAPASKKKRKAITLEEKLEVVKRYERGEKTASIRRATGLSESTLRTIRDNAEKIKESCKSATRLSTARVTITRSATMEKMERLLTTWIEHRNQENEPPSAQAIQAKARSIYELLNRENPDAKEFIASAGWFERFKARHGFHSLRASGEAAAANKNAADKFPSILKAAIEEGSYDPRQVFNLDETGLLWKRMPSRTFLSAEEKTTPEFQAAKDRCTLLLGANAAGDFKLKPLMVYHCANPQELTGYSEGPLPVHWRANRKGWVTGSLFEEYFSSVLHAELRAYCNGQNLPFRTLVLLDNAPGHHPSLGELSENIKVLFLPPNASSLMQPMEQGVIRAFKGYYLRRAFQMLVSETNDKAGVREFWGKFNMKMAIDLIGEAWNDVQQKCLNGVWKNIWPEVVKDLRGFAAAEVLRETRQEIVALAKRAGFEQVDEGNVAELLDSHMEELSYEDLLELDKEHHEEEKPVKAKAKEEPPPRILTAKGMANAFKLLDGYLAFFDENDPNHDRSAKVARLMREANACYVELYREKQHKSAQSSLDKFFRKKVGNRSSTQSTRPQPSTSGGGAASPGRGTD